MSLDSFAYDERVNAILGWLSTAVVALTAVEGFLTDAVLWGCLSLVIVTVASLPAAVTGNVFSMVSWPLPFIAAFAVVLRAVEFYPDITGYMAISTIALLLVVELDIYTDVELSRRFAIVLAVLTTMALQAFWIIAQFYSDLWLGTEFLVSQTELQWDIVYVTAIAVTLGVLTGWYLNRFEPIGSFERPPPGKH